MHQINKDLSKLAITSCSLGQVPPGQPAVSTVRPIYTPPPVRDNNCALHQRCHRIHQRCNSIFFFKLKNVQSHGETFDVSLNRTTAIKLSLSITLTCNKVTLFVFQRSFLHSISNLRIHNMFRINICLSPTNNYIYFYNLQIKNYKVTCRIVSSFDLVYIYSFKLLISSSWSNFLHYFF